MLAAQLAGRAATVGSLVEASTALLTQQPLCYGHGTENAADEAYTLVFDLLEFSFAESESVWERTIMAQQIEVVANGLKKRIEQRMPLPYITGTAWFAGLAFDIDDRALIPRSPIAELIEAGFSPWLAAGGDEAQPRILDLCCGNGCIGIAAAVYLPHARVDLVDISTCALLLAEQNIEKHGLQERVQAIQSDLFAALTGRQYDVIVSNPPYVPDSRMADLPQEYRHEPAMALEARDDGMAIVEKILEKSGNYMKDNGILVVEVGEIMPQLAQRHAALPFTWLEFEHGGEGVFVLNRQDLVS